MIAVNRGYVSETEAPPVGNFLRQGRKNVLFYVDEKNFEDGLEDSTIYVYNSLRQFPENYNVMLSYDRDAGLANDADVVFSRFDPPTEMDIAKKQKEFLEQLVQYENGRLFYNRPSVQLAFRDKGYLQKLVCSGVMPETLFTSSPHEVFTFMRELEEDIVIKPIFGFGGNGIKGFKKENYNGAIDYVESLLIDGQERVIVQRFLPEIFTEGDKRVVVVDGEAVGARLRRPGKGDFRANLHAGGSAEDATVTPRDIRVIEIAKHYLPEIKEGWWGLDIIGEYLGEANVSSPGLAYAIDKHGESRAFIDSILRSVDRIKPREVYAA